MTRRHAKLAMMTLPAATASLPALADEPVQLIAPPAPPPVVMSPAACEVWELDRQLALAVEQHDQAAFAALVHEQAVFGSGLHFAGTRGRENIVRDWQGTLAGKTFRLRWRPVVAVIGGDGRTAIVHGFTWNEDTRPDTQVRWKWNSAEYTSVWTRDADGAWRVLFRSDDLDFAAPAEARDPRLIEQRIEALPARCPQGTP